MPPIRIRCRDVVASGERKGEPCRNYAVVGADPPLCKTHQLAATKMKRPAIERAQEIAKAMFLAEYREHGDITAAARAVGYALATVRDWKAHDPEFGREWEGIRFETVARVELSLVEQATGYETADITRELVPVKGADGETTSEWRVTKEVRRTARSVPAAALWLSGNDPARYRNHKIVVPVEQHRGTDRGLMRKLMADPEVAAKIDALLDADLDGEGN